MSKRKSVRQLLLNTCLLGLFTLPLAAWAQTDVELSFTFDGRLFDSSGNPNISAVNTFRFQILDPGASCVLYEETQFPIDLSNVDPDEEGRYSLKVGSPIGSPKRSGGDPGNAMGTVFSNVTAVAIPGAAPCAAGYTPTSGASRLLRVYVDDGTNGEEQLTPDYVLSSVPSAFVAQTLQGIAPSQIVQFLGTVSQTNVEALTSRMGSLTTLADGTSTAYVRSDGTNWTPGAAINMNAQNLTGLAAPSAGDHAVNKTYSDGNFGGSNLDLTGMADGDSVRWNLGLNKWEIFTPNTAAGTVTSVATGAGLTGGPITTTGTLAVDVGVGPSQIVQLDGTSQLPAVNASQLTNLNATNISSGTLNANRLPATLNSFAVTGGNIDMNSNAITNLATPTGPADGANKTYVDTVAGALVQKAGDTMSGNLDLNGNSIIGLAAPVGANDAVRKAYADSMLGGSDLYLTGLLDGQVLRWNNSQSRFEPYTLTSTGGTVTSVASGVGLSGGPITTTGTLNVDVGTGPSQIVQLNGSGELPAVSAINLSNLNANNIASGTLNKDRLPATLNNFSVTGGNINMSSNTLENLPDPTISTQAANKNYVDSGLGTKLDSTGDNMTGNLSMTNNQITNLATPSAASHAVNKSYADGKLGGNDLSLGGIGDGDVLRWSTGNSRFEPYTPVSTTGTVTSVGTGVGLTGGPIVTAGTINVDVGVTANKIVQLDGTAALPAVSGQALISLNANNISSGTINKDRLPATLNGFSVTGGDINMSSNSITNLATPAAGTDAANKVYVDTALGGKLDKAGGTMTGDIDMSGNDLTNIQSLKTNTQGTLYIGVFSGAQESILTGGLTGGDRGLVWFNATTNKVRFWDGSSANSVASGTHSFNAPFVATPVGEDTQVSLDMGVGLTLNGSTLEADFGSLGAQFHQNSAIPNCTSGQKLQMSVGPPYNWSCVTDQTVPSGAAGGDLSGSYPNPTVYRIQNRVVSATAPTVDQVLKFNGAQWQPQNMNWLENGGNLYRAGGNVGIGTSTPGSKLEVSGTGHFTGDLTSDGKVGVGGAVDASIPLSVHGSGTNVIAVKGTSTTAGIRLESASSGTGNQIYVNDSNNLYIRTDGGIRMRVFDASGITQIEQLQINNDMDANSKKITNLADPTLSGDAANKDYVDQGNKFIGVRYTMSANRTISANVETTLNFDVADFDTDSLVTPGAGWVFTAPKAGYYRVATNIQVYDQLNAGEQMEIILYWQSGARNTNIAGRWGDINGSFPIMTGSTTVYMNAGQTAWLTVLHTQAPNIRVDGTDIYTFLSIDYAGN